MTRPPPRRPAAGQAMVELVVGIVCLLILVLGAGDIYYAAKQALSRLNGQEPV